MNPIALDNIGWKYYIVFVMWLAIESTIIYFAYPETKGPALEELSRLFEEEDPMVKGRLDDGVVTEKPATSRIE